MYIISEIGNDKSKSKSNIQRPKKRVVLVDTVHSFTQQMFTEYLPCVLPVLGPGNKVVGEAGLGHHTACILGETQKIKIEKITSNPGKCYKDSQAG